MESTQEIRREKVFVPSDMNIKDIMNKYGVAETIHIMNDIDTTINASGGWPIA